MGQRRSMAGARVLITGASQGIGRALALSAAKRGAKLILAARNHELLKELAAEVRQVTGDVEIVQADVTSHEDRQRMIQAAVNRFGGLDVLINNAGIGATGHFSEANEDRLRAIFEVNFFGLAETCRLAIPVLRQGVKPIIVNIGSAVGKRAFPSRSEYSASKFAVQGLTEALRAELVRFGIDVIIVSPGLTNTSFPKNMLENKARVPLDHLRSMSPEQVAEITLRAAERGKNDSVLTWQGKALNWMNRLFPRWVDRIMAKKVRKLYKDEIDAWEQEQQLRRDEKALAVSR